MLAARFHDQRGFDSLQLDEIDRPSPGGNDVLVRVRAASVNAIDLRILGGEFPFDELPAILGGDVAGEVAAVGEGVDGLDVGARVFGAPMSLERWGTFAEYAVVPAERLGRLPEAVSFQDAAAVASVGTSAYDSLVRLGGLSVGETCLIHGGSGGVGHVAVQLADASGATVVATADESYREDLESMGADAVVDYDSPTLAEDIERNAPRGVDVVVDHRIDDYLPLDLSVAADGARVVAIQGDVPATSAAPLRNKGIEILGRSGEQFEDRRPFYEDVLAPLLVDGVLEPHIYESFPLSDVVEAERTKRDESVFGKIVLTA